MSLLVGTRRALLRKDNSYKAKVLSYGPIAYWMQDETSGSVAYCQISGAQNGAYTGVTLGQSGIGDGRTSPLYDGANDYTNIYSAALAAAFNGGEGTIALWARVVNVGMWTDATQRNPCRFLADGNNLVQLYRAAANNTLGWQYRANGTNETVTLAGLTTVDWFHIAITWSASAGVNGEMRAYYRGTQTGVTQVALDVWAGALNVNNTVLGAGSNTPTIPWNGYINHGAVWDRPLLPIEIADLAVL